MTHNLLVINHDSIIRLDNIRTDYPSNQLFYSINRIPRTEENYDPGT